MKEIQKKYAGDKERQSQEMMKLYRRRGPTPVLVSADPGSGADLLRVVPGPAGNGPGQGRWGPHTGTGRPGSRGQHFRGSDLRHIPQRQRDPNPTATHVVTLVMIILMSATTFITQRQLIVKNTAADNPMVRQQKILLYVFP